MSKKTLSLYNFILLIDKSGSMSKPGTSGKPRWTEAQETTEALARKAETFDTDGITVIPFASTYKTYDGVTADKVAQIFAENEPNGSTNTAAALQYVFDAYLSGGRAKPILVVVVTDGAPDDESAVKNAIRQFAAQLSDNGTGDTDEAGILFLQVGDDPGARAFLQELDDGLDAQFDIVDTRTMAELEGMTLTDALLAALDD